MPAPSSMLGRQQTLSLTSAEDSGEDVTGAGVGSQSVFNGRPRTLSEVSTGEASSSVSRAFDEVFTSKPVSETKTMLWEIKDFVNVFSSRVERAMNFEFEVGRLGSMERHLPRRSRWKIMMDAEEERSGANPALRILKLFPENKIMFYRLEARIVDGTGGNPPDFSIFETTSNDAFREGINDTNSSDNIFPFRCNTPCFGLNDESNLFVNRVRTYLSNGSLFISVKMEILEDTSSQ